jgi:hypothetical protein
VLTACALLSRAYVLHVRTALPSRLYAYGFNVRTAYEAIALGIYEERAYGLHVRTSCALLLCVPGLAKIDQISIDI